MPGSQETEASISTIPRQRLNTLEMPQRWRSTPLKLQSGLLFDPQQKKVPQRICCAYFHSPGLDKVLRPGLGKNEGLVRTSRCQTLSSWVVVAIWGEDGRLYRVDRLCAFPLDLMQLHSFLHNCIQLLTVNCLVLSFDYVSGSLGLHCCNMTVKTANYLLE
jgi:hypothetical protein